MIQKLIESLVGKTKKKEYLCFCCPGKPVAKNFDTDVHQTFLTNILISLGYTVDSIPEALAIIFSEIPVAQGEDGEETYTGIAMSFGAGMCNVCLARRKIPLINFAIAQSGDWIDRESAKAAGLPVSAMTSFKEKKFSLEKVDYTHMKQACLDIHYQAMIRHAVQTFSRNSILWKRKSMCAGDRGGRWHCQRAGIYGKISISAQNHGIALQSEEFADGKKSIVCRGTRMSLESYKLGAEIKA
jgi:hypothetical protein